MDVAIYVGNVSILYIKILVIKCTLAVWFIAIFPTDPGRWVPFGTNIWPPLVSDAPYADRNYPVKKKYRTDT